MQNIAGTFNSLLGPLFQIQIEELFYNMNIGGDVFYVAHYANK